VRRRAILVVPQGQGPHPGASYGRGVDFQDTPDNGAVGEHVKIVIVPLAGGTRAGRVSFGRGIGTRPAKYAGKHHRLIVFSGMRLRIDARCTHSELAMLRFARLR